MSRVTPLSVSANNWKTYTSLLAYYYMSISRVQDQLTILKAADTQGFTLSNNAQGREFCTLARRIRKALNRRWNFQ